MLISDIFLAEVPTVRAENFNLTLSRTGYRLPYRNVKIIGKTGSR